MFGYEEITEIKEGMHGLYKIGHDAYHNGPGYSSTKVKKALGSFASYSMPTPDNEAFAIGRAFHMALLEPDEFDKCYSVLPDIPGHKNSNAYKEAYAIELEKCKGKTVLDKKDFDLICAMIDSANRHPDFSQEGFDAEVMAITTCKETGLLIKCKADLLGKIILDPKTTSGSVKPDEFLYDAVKYGYHISAAFYCDIVGAIIGTTPKFRLMPISKSAPHDCEIYELSPEIIEEGRKLYKAGLKRIASWDKMEQKERELQGKKIRVLEISPRVLYNTNNILNYIGE